MSIKTAVFAVNASPLVTDEALFEKALAAVTPARREKAARYRKKEDAALSLAAEWLLRHAFATAGVPFPTVFSKSAHGKPFAPDCPLRYSLSHSGEWAVCAVSGNEVGCDVEKIDPAHTGVAARFYTAAEQAQLTAVDEDERVRRFFRIWTIKESFIKAADAGLSLSDFSVRLGEPSAVENETAVFGEYTELPGYACALCLRAGEKTPPLTVMKIGDLLK